MKVFKNHIKLIVAFVLLGCLCGCFNLGDFEDEQNYYDTFDEVTLISLDKSIRSYSVEEYFYTEEGVNDYECDVPKGQYIYAAIKVGKEIALDDLSLSFYSDYNDSLYVSVFLVDSIPSSIRGYDDDKDEDDEGNEIVYDDPITPIETGVIPLESGKWRSTMLVDCSKNNYLDVTEGQYILIRFENNSWSGKQNGYSKLEFTLTNLLISAQRS